MYADKRKDLLHIEKTYAIHKFIAFMKEKYVECVHTDMMGTK